MPTHSTSSAPLSSSERRKRWRERNRHLTKERTVILPTGANEELLKIAARLDLSPSTILLAGLYAVSSLDPEHLHELSLEASSHYGKGRLGKNHQEENFSASSANGDQA